MSHTWASQAHTVPCMLQSQPQTSNSTPHEPRPPAVEPTLAGSKDTRRPPAVGPGDAEARDACLAPRDGAEAVVVTLSHIVAQSGGTFNYFFINHVTYVGIPGTHSSLYVSKSAANVDRGLRLATLQLAALISCILPL